MNRLLNHRKLNNKGMTLIEVMVAVIILSLVGGVLLKGFSTSAVLNRDAKEKQQAMVLAQSLMESLKAYDTDELETQFGTGVTNSNFKLYKLSGSSSKSYSLDASNNKIFELNNIEFDGKLYDAKAKLSPTATKTPFVESSAANVYTDAIFRGAESAEFAGFHDVVVDELAMLNAVPLPYGHSYDLASKTTINSREMTITIDANQVTFDVSYNFTVNNLEYESGDPTTGVVTTEYFTDTLDCTVSYSGQTYNNTATGATLGNVYLYYFPVYEVNTHMYCNMDKLKIINNSGSAKDVYLIKQKSTMFASNPSLFNSGEALYKLNVEGSGDQVNLYHNVNETFTSGAPDIVLNASNVINSGSPWKLSATDTVLLYDVEIDIYKAGDTTSIHKLEGTVNAK